MCKPHKHAEIIKAWADGAEIEWKNPNCASPVWQPIDNAPMWFQTFDYRVKPQPVMTERYRKFLYHNKSAGKYYVMVQSAVRAGWNPEQMGGFVRWIDTDWQQHEV